MRAIAMSLTIVVALSAAVATDQASAQNRRTRFRVDTNIPDEDADAADPTRRAGRRLTEAPTGFDNETNGFLPQGPDFDTIDEDNVVPLRSFNDNRFIFEEVETVEDGLGPDLQRAELPRVPPERRDRRREPDRRAPHGPHGRRRVLRIARRLADPVARDASRHRRARRLRGHDPHVPHLDQHARRRLRRGDREQHAARDPRPAARGDARHGAARARARGQEAQARIGRFGWKSQHASLESFSADAYLNEMGITTPLFPEENTSSGEYVGYGTGYDPVADPEDDGVDVVAFADFMRCDEGAVARPDHARRARRRAAVHAHRLRNLPRRPRSRPRRRARGSTAARSACREALGNKIIHPYSDFLLHDIGTGDGIPGPADAGVCGDGEPDPHRAALGAAHAQPPDARRPRPYQAGGDPAPRRPGGVGKGEVQRAVRSREAARVEVLGFAIAKVTAGVRSAE